MLKEDPDQTSIADARSSNGANDDGLRFVAQSMNSTRVGDRGRSNCKTTGRVAMEIPPCTISVPHGFGTHADAAEDLEGTTSSASTFEGLDA